MFTVNLKRRWLCRTTSGSAKLHTRSHRVLLSLWVRVSIYIYIHIYIYTHTCYVYIYIYIYTHICTDLGVVFIFWPPEPLVSYLARRESRFFVPVSTSVVWRPVAGGAWPVPKRLGWLNTTPRHVGVSENRLNTPKPNGFADHYPYEKWLFHWEYTLFSDKPMCIMCGYWEALWWKTTETQNFDEYDMNFHRLVPTINHKLVATLIFYGGNMMNKLEGDSSYSSMPCRTDDFLSNLMGFPNVEAGHLGIASQHLIWLCLKWVWTWKCWVYSQWNSHFS